MTTRLRALLEMRLAELRKTIDLQRNEPTPGTLYVFGNEIGQQVTTIKTAWTLALERAKIEDLHFHDLRREAGSRWMDGGVQLATIQKWLGHANISQTSVYLATTARGEHEAMKRFEERRLTQIDSGRKRSQRKVPLGAKVPTKKPRENTVKH
jgi:integrase